MSRQATEKQTQLPVYMLDFLSRRWVIFADVVNMELIETEARYS